MAKIDEMIVSFPGGRRVDASFDGLRVETDQSADDGGDGSAPAPFDYFMASIATCAGIYVLRFCQKRRIPTDGVRVVQRIQRNDEKKIETVAISIEVPPDFPEKYHSALERAAAQCAVKRFIESPPAFDINTKVTAEITG